MICRTTCSYCRMGKIAAINKCTWGSKTHILSHFDQQRNFFGWTPEVAVWQKMWTFEDWMFCITLQRCLNHVLHANKVEWPNITCISHEAKDKGLFCELQEHAYTCPDWGEELSLGGAGVEWTFPNSFYIFRKMVCTVWAPIYKHKVPQGSRIESVSRLWFNARLHPKSSEKRVQITRYKSDEEQRTSTLDISLSGKSCVFILKCIHSFVHLSAWHHRVNKNSLLSTQSVCFWSIGRNRRLYWKLLTMGWLHRFNENE